MPLIGSFNDGPVRATQAHRRIQGSHCWTRSQHRRTGDGRVSERTGRPLAERKEYICSHREKKKTQISSTSCCDTFSLH